MGFPHFRMTDIDHRSQVVLAGLFLAAVTLALYWPVQNFAFVAYDDTAYVTENRIVQEGLSADGVRWAFSSFEAANWHPLAWLSHMLDADLYALNAGGHHWTSVLIHAMGALMLLVALVSMTGSVWASFLTAMLFAVHPLHVESVAWVAERKDVLSGLFWFLCLAAYAFYVKKPTARRYLAVLFALALGLLSKPMAVTLPFVLLLLDYWPLRRFEGAATVFDGLFRAATSGEATASFGRLAVEKAPLMALVIASCILTLAAQGGGGAVIALEQIPLDARIANAIVAYVEYLGKTVWPAGLAMFYPHVGMPPAWKIAASVLVLAALTGLAVRSARRYPYVPVGWFWYLGTLVPVIGIVQVGSQSMADRYTYIPLVGIFVALSWSLRDIAGKGPAFRGGVIASTAAGLLGFLVASHAQVGTWMDSKTLFTHALEVVEANPVVHNNLGVIYLNEGDCNRAVAHFHRALEVRPRYADALYNLGLCAFKAGNRQEAARYFDEALKEAPQSERAHVYLGFIQLENRQPASASDHFRQALRIRPDQEAAHHHLAIALMQQADYIAAERHLRETVKLNPRNPEAYNNLGVVLMAQGRYDEAVEALRTADALAPGRPVVEKNLERARAGSL